LLGFFMGFLSALAFYLLARLLEITGLILALSFL